MSQKLYRDDCVRILDADDEEPRYGYIVKYDSKKKLWRVTEDGIGDDIYVPEEQLEFVPPYKLTPSVIKKYIRHILTYKDFTDNAIPEGNVVCGEPYCFTLADTEAMLKNIAAQNPNPEELEDWAALILYDLDDYIDISEEPHYAAETFLGQKIPLNEAAMASAVLEQIHGYMQENYTPDGKPDIDIKQILADIKRFRSGKPIACCRWSLSNKNQALDAVKDIDSLSDDEKEELRSLLFEMADEGSPRALHILAYQYYGGGSICDCNWEKSRDCLLELMDSDSVDDLDRCHYANTLGYIYYYGRCTGGEPEYDKAFEYFTLGAAGGIYESMYKLSDMYLHGYYVRRNVQAAEIPLRIVYDKNIELLERGDFDCCYADAALRLGNLCREGIIKDESAAAYYLQAQYAIRRRSHYGDERVAYNINKALDAIYTEKPAMKPAPLKGDNALLAAFRLLVGHPCEVSIKPLKSGTKVTLKRLPLPRESEAESVFDTYPEYRYCDLITSASFTAHDAEFAQLDNNTANFVADAINTATLEGLEYVLFMRDGQPVFGLRAKELTRTLPRDKKLDTRVFRFASVTFTDGGKTYDYLCADENINVGDTVTVKTNDGDADVKVVRVFEAKACDMPLPFERYKKLSGKV